MISPKLLKTLSTAQVNQALTDTLDDLAELFSEMRRRLGHTRRGIHEALTIVEAPTPAPTPTINGLDPEERTRPRRERKPKSTPAPPAFRITQDEEETRLFAGEEGTAE